MSLEATDNDAKSKEEFIAKYSSTIENILCDVLREVHSNVSLEKHLMALLSEGNVGSKLQCLDGSELTNLIRNYAPVGPSDLTGQEIASFGNCDTLPPCNSKRRTLIAGATKSLFEMLCGPHEGSVVLSRPKLDVFVSFDNFCLAVISKFSLIMHELLMLSSDVDFFEGSCNVSCGVLHCWYGLITCTVHNPHCTNNIPSKLEYYCSSLSCLESIMIAECILDYFLTKHSIASGGRSGKDKKRGTISEYNEEILLSTLRRLVSFEWNKDGLLNHSLALAANCVESNSESDEITVSLNTLSCRRLWILLYLHYYDKKIFGGYFDGESLVCCCDEALLCKLPNAPSSVSEGVNAYKSRVFQCVNFLQVLLKSCTGSTPGVNSSGSVALNLFHSHIESISEDAVCNKYSYYHGNAIVSNVQKVKLTGETLLNRFRSSCSGNDGVEPSDEKEPTLKRKRNTIKRGTASASTAPSSVDRNYFDGLENSLRIWYEEALSLLLQPSQSQNEHRHDSGGYAANDILFQRLATQSSFNDCCLVEGEVDVVRNASASGSHLSLPLLLLRVAYELHDVSAWLKLASLVIASQSLNEEHIDHLTLYMPLLTSGMRGNAGKICTCTHCCGCGSQTAIILDCSEGNFSLLLEQFHATLSARLLVISSNFLDLLRSPKSTHHIDLNAYNKLCIFSSKLFDHGILFQGRSKDYLTFTESILCVLCVAFVGSERFSEELNAVCPSLLPSITLCEGLVWFLSTLAQDVVFSSASNALLPFRGAALPWSGLAVIKAAVGRWFNAEIIGYVVCNCIDYLGCSTSDGGDVKLLDDATAARLSLLICIGLLYNPDGKSESYLSNELKRDIILICAEFFVSDYVSETILRYTGSSKSWLHVRNKLFIKEFFIPTVQHFVRQCYCNILSTSDEFLLVSHDNVEQFYAYETYSEEQLMSLANHLGQYYYKEHRDFPDAPVGDAIDETDLCYENDDRLLTTLALFEYAKVSDELGRYSKVKLRAAYRHIFMHSAFLGCTTAGCEVSPFPPAAHLLSRYVFGVNIDKADSVQEWAPSYLCEEEIVVNFLSNGSVKDFLKALGVSPNTVLMDQILCSSIADSLITEKQNGCDWCVVAAKRFSDMASVFHHDFVSMGMPSCIDLEFRDCLMDSLRCSDEESAGEAVSKMHVTKKAKLQKPSIFTPYQHIKVHDDVAVTNDVHWVFEKTVDACLYDIIMCYKDLYFNYLRIESYKKLFDSCVEIQNAISDDLAKLLLPIGDTAQNIWSEFLQTFQEAISTGDTVESIILLLLAYSTDFNEFGVNNEHARGMDVCVDDADGSENEGGYIYLFTLENVGKIWKCSTHLLGLAERILYTNSRAAEVNFMEALMLPAELDPSSLNKYRSGALNLCRLLFLQQICLNDVLHLGAMVTRLCDMKIVEVTSSGSSMNAIDECTKSDEVDAEDEENDDFEEDLVDSASLASSLILLSRQVHISIATVCYTISQMFSNNSMAISSNAICNMQSQLWLKRDCDVPVVDIEGYSPHLLFFQYTNATICYLYQACYSPVVPAELRNSVFESVDEAVPWCHFRGVLNNEENDLQYAFILHNIASLRWTICCNQRSDWKVAGALTKYIPVPVEYDDNLGDILRMLYEAYAIATLKNSSNGGSTKEYGDVIRQSQDAVTSDVVDINVKGVGGSSSGSFGKKEPEWKYMRILSMCQLCTVRLCVSIRLLVAMENAPGRGLESVVNVKLVENMEKLSFRSTLLASNSTYPELISPGGALLRDRLWFVVFDCFCGLRYCRNKIDIFDYRSTYQVATSSIEVEELVNTVKRVASTDSKKLERLNWILHNLSVVLKGWNVERYLAGSFDKHGFALQEMSVLFNKKRSQIVGVWKIDSSGNLLDHLLRQREVTYMNKRCALIRAYTNLIKEKEDFAKSEELLSYIGNTSNSMVSSLNLLSRGSNCAGTTRSGHSGLVITVSDSFLFQMIVDCHVHTICCEANKVLKWFQGTPWLVELHDAYCEREACHVSSKDDCVKVGLGAAASTLLLPVEGSVAVAAAVDNEGSSLETFAHTLQTPHREGSPVVNNAANSHVASPVRGSNKLKETDTKSVCYFDESDKVVAMLRKVYSFYTSCSTVPRSESGNKSTKYLLTEAQHNSIGSVLKRMYNCYLLCSLDEASNSSVLSLNDISTDKPAAFLLYSKLGIDLIVPKIPKALASYSRQQAALTASSSRQNCEYGDEKMQVVNEVDSQDDNGEPVRHLKTNSVEETETLNEELNSEANFTAAPCSDAEGTRIVTPS